MALNRDMLPMSEITDFFTRAKSLKVTSKALSKKSGYGTCTISHWKTKKTTPTLLAFSMLERALVEIDNENKNKK